MVIYMSHWTVLTVKISNPNLNVLKMALDALARDLNSSVVENFEVIGYSGREKCIYGIPVKLPYGNGYGVMVKNGELVVVVDDHGAPLSAREFMNKLVQYYSVIAVIIAAHQSGFRVQNIDQTGDGVIIDLAW